MQKNNSPNHTFEQSYLTSKRNRSAHEDQTWHGYARDELRRNMSGSVSDEDRVDELKGNLYLQETGLKDDFQWWKMDTKTMKDESCLETNNWPRRQNCRNPEQVSAERNCPYVYGNIQDLGEGEEIKYLYGSKTSDNVLELKATVTALQNSISYLEEENMILNKQLKEKRVATCINASETCPNKTREGYEKPWDCTAKSNAHSHIVLEPKCDPIIEGQGYNINSHMKVGELKVKEELFEVELENDAPTMETTNDHSNKNNPTFSPRVEYAASEKNRENTTAQGGGDNGDCDKKSLLRKLSETQKQNKSCLKDLRNLVRKYEESREQLNVKSAAFERVMQEKQALSQSLQKVQEENESLSATLSETKREKREVQDALQRARDESESGNHHLTEAAYRLIREKQLLEEMETQLREDLEDCRHQLHQSASDIRDLREKEQRLAAAKEELLTKMEKEREENRQLEAALKDKERANHFAQKELEKLRHQCNVTEQKLRAELEEARFGQSSAVKSAQGMREELRATGRIVQALKDDKKLLQRELDETNRARVRAESEAKRKGEALLQNEELAQELLREKDMVELEFNELREDYLHLSDRIAVRMREMHIEEELEGHKKRSADDVGDGVGNGK